MPYGINDLKSVVRINANWDLAYMKQWKTADGVTWDRVVSRLGAALLLFNSSLRTGFWSNFYRVTTDSGIEYAIGSDSGELPVMPEHNRPDLFSGDASGHMIPMRDYGGGLGWTSLALRRGSLASLDLSVTTLIDRAHTTWDKRIMERLFHSTAIRVGKGGLSLPFADGGDTDAGFVPVSVNGKDFDATHNHYLRYADDAAGRSAALVAGAEHLREHGHASPYVMVIPEADVAVWMAQTEVTKPERAAILTAGIEARAVVPEGDIIIGVWETDRSWGYLTTAQRLPANYAGMFKMYGPNNPNSPLVIRSEPGYPLGLAIEGQVIQFPLQEASAMFTFGVGVNARTNGVAIHFAAAGDYVDPVIA